MALSTHTRVTMLLMALMMAPVRSLVLGPGPPAAPRSFKLDDEQPHDMRRGIQCLRQNAVLADDTVVYLRGGQFSGWKKLLTTFGTTFGAPSWHC